MVSTETISGLTGKPSSRSRSNASSVAGHRRPAVDLAQLVAPHRQLALGGHRGVLLAQGPRRGVAGVDERRLPCRGRPFVEGVEGVRGHVDLAAHLEDPRRARGQGRRNGADRPHIGGDVLADAAVAPGGGLHQLAVLVAQRDRHPVDLELADVAVVDRGVAVGNPEAALQPLVPGPQIVLVEGVVQREQRRRVHDRCEQLGPTAADLLSGRVLTSQRRVLRLEVAQLAHEGVVVGIADDRGVVDVVALVVLEQLVPQRGDPTDRVGRGDDVTHLRDGTRSP